jgi:altronate dehydratase
MDSTFAFDQVGRIPAPGDNAAIAVRRLAAGTRITGTPGGFTLPHTVLEGHRFAVVPIAPGEPITSWGLPFGLATRPIAPGDYLCNEKVLTALKQRHAEFALPDSPNFKNHRVPFQVDEHTFKPGQQVPSSSEPLFFEGFARGEARGVGTRNFVVVLGTSSRTASYARALAERFKQVPDQFPNIDGVVAVAHTEGGGTTIPNNLEFTLRTLAGFLVNPNVAAALAVDLGTEAVTNAMLQQYLADHQYPLAGLPLRFLSLSGNFLPALAAGEAIVKTLLEPANACQRTRQSVAHLRIGLQCGGSDAFSGVSGNPLVGWVSKELIRHGGSANLAETDELIGAEPYVLSNVRDLATARAFLRQLEIFQERAGWHGHGAEGNPSGGNVYRGLYNIVIKSIGAARKKDPEQRLDYVIDFGQRMTAPGYYFMDSPGNDLESIAGQVAAGCNIILFTTGNGSITNFPFVPTIKLMTNTGRYRMLTHEMDVNAGRYLDGTPMDELGRETFELFLQVASGKRSAGELAGHSQVQLWREWRQTDASRLKELQDAPRPDGEPLQVNEGAWPALMPLRTRAEQVGLIVPTSLCSGQIAQLIADKLNHAPAARTNGITRYVALAHTEGCGNSAGDAEQLFLRTMVGYLRHPSVKRGLMLEHGCEKTHNDALRNFLVDENVDPDRFGFASVQMDGGIGKVTEKVTAWFNATSTETTPAIQETGWKSVQLGLTAVGSVPAAVAAACAQLVRGIVHAGGTVIIPENSALLKSPAFRAELSASPALAPTIAYGQIPVKRGLHIMQTPTDHSVETLTGLGATGVTVMLAHVSGPALQAHPLVPLIQVASTNDGQAAANDHADFDLVLGPAIDTAPVLAELARMVAAVASRDYTPKLFAEGNVDFQMTRGLLGVSL